MLEEFKKFALKGNVVDMAVGIIIGAAFGKIVSSLVKDILMPPIGLLMGNMDFSQLFINLSDKTYETLALAEAAGAPVIKYGAFINSVLDFLIVAFAIFMAIKVMSNLRKQEAEAPAAAPTTKKCPECCSEIPLEARRCAHCTSPQPA